MDPTIDPSTLPHDSRENVLIGVVCLMCSLATISVGLRFYTRQYMVKQVGADDYLSLLALALAWATGISMCHNTRNGLGKHVWDLDGPKQIMNYLRGFWASITLYNAGLMFVKLTFLMQYYRVLAIRKMRIICVVAMIIIGCWSLSQVLVGIFICAPNPGVWECIPNLPQWYINAAGNIVTDVVIFLLPLPVLGRLNLPKAQKLVLFGIFSLGFFTCAISVIRIKFLQNGSDFSYDNIEESSWSITELCSGVICACLSTLRPLVSRWVPALSNKLHKTSNWSRRRSGSHATDVEKGSKHTRQSLKGSNITGAYSKEGLYHLGTYELRRNGSGETSDGILGLKSTREGMYGDDASSSSPTSPKSAHFAIPATPRDVLHDDWLRPSVTAKIWSSNSPRPHFSLNHNGSSIQVKRDHLMQKSSYPME
ncbi:Uu.00g049440.m01.CDS01 [Anthostomella pinea]|uniref:Uu.00g049440.m01.CDS01 n=1 Tax=Anthostomella pinea TaxID=933095 RepID=A0AAI8VCX4_9PEZI|nr:Uu.00g049440.m01.CDS01 [Anthostomella pinea]